MIESVDIIIPTIRTVDQIRPQMENIENTIKIPHRIIATCFNGSAAVNRNIGLKYADTPFIVMLDDDITGFFHGWDVELLFPFCLDPQLHLISARLMNRDGNVGPNCSNNYDMSKEYVYIPPKGDHVLPTAAIAFRNIGLSFDENFIGSGWEDNDFMFQYLRKVPGCKFMINNNCKLIHLNEMKNQQGRYFAHNRNYFYRKWIRK